MLSSLLPETVTASPTVSGRAEFGAWPTLLVVDNDTATTQRIVWFFEKRGIHVAAGASLAEAQEYFRRRKSWTLVLSDYHLPDGTGVELSDWIRQQGCSTPVLLMSASPHFSSMDSGDILAKPFELEKLEAIVRRAQRRMALFER
jgi:DNA-binding response OmpR family regulator